MARLLRHLRVHLAADISGAAGIVAGVATTGEQPELFPGGAQPSPAVMLEVGPPAPTAGLRIDWYELLVLVAFAAVSMWTLALNLYYAHTHGLVWTGADGQYPGDQMQYLAWIRDASRHVLASDLFVPWPTPHDYLQPMVALSGGLVAVGMAPWLALLLWQPIALLAVFFAVRAYCRRMLAGRWERRAALTLALFAAYRSVLGDEWLPFLSWGYPYALASVAALVGALLCYDRARTDGRTSWLAPVLGLLASWLHPWEGEILLLIVAGAELVGLRESLRRGLRRQLPLPAVMIAATALPLAYYAALQRFDPEWRAARVVGVASHGQSSLRVMLTPLIPLLVAAAFAYLRRPRGFLATATLVWPLATLADWALNETSAGGGGLHSWTGITIPLGVLAVIGLRNAGFGRVPGRRWLGAAAVAALTIPATVYMLHTVQTQIAPAQHQENLIITPESRALRYLASDPQPGSVLTEYTWGAEVAGQTGRRVYASGLAWAGSGRLYRADAAARLLSGPWYWWVPPNPRYLTSGWQLRPARMTGRAARAFVLSTGARFVLANCGSHADLSRWLRPIARAVHRFGCATVYEVS